MSEETPARKNTVYIILEQIPHAEKDVWGEVSTVEAPNADTAIRAAT